MTDNLPFRRSEPIYKKLVEAGFIESNQEAKRLIKEGAIKLCAPGSYKKDGYKVKLEDTMELIMAATLEHYYLKIGKFTMEPLSVERENGPVCD